MFSIKITRRQFLKWLSASAAALGLSQTDLLKLEKAFAAGPTPDPNMPAGTLARVVWIAGAACSGCPTSLLNYLADPNDPDVVLKAVATNGASVGLYPLIPFADIDVLYPSFQPPLGAPDGDLDIAEVVLEIITVEYAQIVMAASGDVANDYLKQLWADGGYVLLVEGTIQTAANGKYCRIMDVSGDLTALPGWPAAATPYVDVYNDPQLGVRTDVTMAGGTLWLAKNAAAVVTLGTCAAYGGVPAAKKSVTGGMGADQWINVENDMGKLLVNIPGCPPNSNWIIATVAAAILELNNLPTPTSHILLNNLDTTRCQTVNGKKMPRLTYTGVYHNGGSEYVFCVDDPRNGEGATTPHVACQRSAANPKGRCLKLKGCNGWMPAIVDGAHIRPDCATRMWNKFEDFRKNNWCVLNNSPCNGCASPGFPDYCSPFYEQTKGVWRGYSYLIPPS